LRRTLIQNVLPLIFCLVPLLAAALIAAALPANARNFYLEQLTSPEHYQDHLIDILILVLGCTLFATQLVLAWRALHWRGTSFDERPDAWLTNLAQAAEWFPLLGLLGTVAGILQTFSRTHAGVQPEEIIQNYAPAITATGSGLLMALLNILPTWVVLLGRQIIQSLSGGEAAPDKH
jgi:hypothetical protein